MIDPNELETKKLHLYDEKYHIEQLIEKCQNENMDLQDDITRKLVRNPYRIC